MHSDNLDLQIERKRAGITQDVMAVHLETSPSSLSKFETGRLVVLPNGKGREEYTAVLRQLAATAAAS